MAGGVRGEGGREKLYENLLPRIRKIYVQNRRGIMEITLRRGKNQQVSIVKHTIHI